MVAVEMCDEDVAELIEGESLPHEPELCSLSAINHKEIATVVDYRR